MSALAEPALRVALWDESWRPWFPLQHSGFGLAFAGAAGQAHLALVAPCSWLQQHQHRCQEGLGLLGSTASQHKAGGAQTGTGLTMPGAGLSCGYQQLLFGKELWWTYMH